MDDRKMTWDEVVAELTKAKAEIKLLRSATDGVVSLAKQVCDGSDPPNDVEKGKRQGLRLAWEIISIALSDTKR